VEESYLVGVGTGDLRTRSRGPTGGKGGGEGGQSYSTWGDGSETSSEIVRILSTAEGRIIPVTKNLSRWGPNKKRRGVYFPFS